MNEPNETCEICGGELEYSYDQHPGVVKCKNCDYTDFFLWDASLPPMTEEEMSYYNEKVKLIYENQY